MKKNMMMRIASVLLVAVLLSTCAISGTFAKYVTTYSGSDNARIAKWDVKVNTVSADATSKNFNFNLFDTINDTKDSNDETDVADGLIAPGTEGEFSIQLNTDSEVRAEYTVAYSVTNTSNIPVLFSTDGGSSWAADITDVGATSLEIGAQTKTHTVMWKWAYEQADVAAGDTADVTLGKDGTATITVSATVTVTQVD